MSMQTNPNPQNNPNINTNGIINNGTNMIPITNFNPSLPTEPLPYEETFDMQKSVMEVSSPFEKVIICSTRIMSQFLLLTSIYH